MVAAQQSRRDLVLELAGFVLALAGLAVLARGVWDAGPIVFFSPDVERESARSGREIMLAGTAILTLLGLVAFTACVPRRPGIGER